MSVRLAYTSVVIIWSTTPLAIKWSSEGGNFLFGVTSRMLLGVVAAWLIVRAFNKALPLHSRAVKTYIASGLGIYLAMSCVYWTSQHIPSGLISVVFGLSPILTGIMATIILRENILQPVKLLGMSTGFAGLVIIFGTGPETHFSYVSGIAAVFTGTLTHSLSAVAVKKIDAGIGGFASSTGGLTIAAPLFLLTWLLLDGQPPGTINTRALIAILYLGIIASALGFSMYYYVLSRLDVERVS